MNASDNEMTLIYRLRELIEQKTVHDMRPFLFTLAIDGKPFTLDHHFAFEPMFKLRRPKRRGWKTARQVGKSYSIGADSTLCCGLFPGYSSLFVCPRFEQVKRLNTEVIKPMLEGSPWKSCYFDAESYRSVLQRTYLQGGRQYFSFAFLDAERIRGYTGIKSLYLDEIQDICWDFLPIIGETMSAAKDFGFFTYTGTPKTFDNTIERLWRRSSQAEWVTLCERCGKFNIPSAEQDLLKMIGKQTVVCAKCGKPLECENGCWVHAYPERTDSFPFYHISQVIHPLHYRYPGQWSELLYKMSTYDTFRFYNEVLGESYDSATKLMTEDVLQQISVGNNNEVEAAIKELHGCTVTCMGVDWGGGGDGKSYTTVAVGGIPPGTDGVVCAFATKLNPSLTPPEQAGQILALYTKFRPTFFAHDYNSFGAIQEALLIQAGLPPDRIVPFTYSLTPTRNIINFHQAHTGYRSSYVIDKTRSICVLCEMMKGGKVKLPDWKSQYLPLSFSSDGRTADPICADFLSLYQEVTETPRGGDILLIKRSLDRSDDFVHALNFVCAALWYNREQYPDLAEATKLRLTAEQIEMLSPERPEW